MTLDKSISLGSIISWILMLMGLAAGYAKLQSATTQNAKDVFAATELANRVDTNQRTLDASRSAQINALTVDVAVTKATVGSMDKKLDEIIRRINTQNP